VLLVDDNPVNLLVAASMLDHCGVEVVQAENGRQALELLRQEPFELVLMDCLMPELDGFEATAAIRARARPDAPPPPIVALTAEILPSDAGRYRAAGIDDQVIKPVTEEALVATLLKWGNRCHLPDPQVQA